MPAKESFDIDSLMVFRSDLTAVDQDGNIVAGVITPDRYFPSDREPLSSEQTGRYTNTTAYWESHSSIVPSKGDVYIYSDGGSIEQGGVTVNIPKIKVGDGVTTIDNLPFTDSDNQGGGEEGTLDTTNTSAQTPNASESLSGNVNLHKVAKTGSYDDLLNKPTIPTVNDATLTIQKNSTTIDTFSANASQNKTINITVPTTASDVGALPSSTKYAASLSLSIDSSTYVVTAQLKDQDGNNLGSAGTIDLPLESVVVSGSYNSQTKKVVLTLQNGSTVEFSVADLVAGLQSEITAQNPLSADLVVDGTTNKVFTLTMKTKLDGIEAGAEVNVQSDWSETDTTSDAYILHKPDLDATLYESVTYSQLVTKINNSQLVKGRKYRITDYVTTTTQSNTSSAGHAFDLVVTAIDVNKFDCKASALLHSGDTYFSTAGADLSKWQIWYDVNNYTNKYKWADTTNGKGVIYRMIDDFGNDCPYDFKNILFVRKLTNGVYDPTNGTNTNVYTFSTYNNSTGTVKDASLKTTSAVKYNVFGNNHMSATYYFLGDNVFLGAQCFSNKFGNSCMKNTFAFGCSENTFGNNCTYNTFGSSCSSNILGDSCGSITLGDGCGVNTFGNNCTHVIFGDQSNNYGSIVKNVVVEPLTMYVRLYQSVNSQSDYLQNIYISQGVSGTSNNYLEISTIERGLSYRTTVGRDSSGNIRIYNEDDPASASQAQANWNETDTADPAFIKNKPQNIVTDANYVHTDNNYTTTEKNKLAGIENGAEVNVQSDWNQSDSTADDYIKNKPTIPTVPTNVSAFTNDAGYLTQETDPTVPAWAKAANKPTYDYSEINNTPTIPSAPGTLTTNATASQTASAGEAMSGNITLHKVSKTGSYDDLNDKPTITDENVKQEPTSSESSFEFPLLSSVTSTTNVTKTNTTRYSENLLMRGADGSIILKISTNNTLDTPSLFFRRGSDSNTGTDWAIRSTGVETGQNTPLEFLRRYGSGSSSWVSKLALYTNLLKTEVSDGFESPKFVKSNPRNANGVLLADGTDIPQSTFQPALPAYTNNEGKVLAVNSGATNVEWIKPVVIYSGSSAPSSSLGSDGDIYIQTQS